jgi:hypothetical protein
MLCRNGFVLFLRGGKIGFCFSAIGDINTYAPCLVLVIALPGKEGLWRHLGVSGRV